MRVLLVLIPVCSSELEADDSKKQENLTTDSLTGSETRDLLTFGAVKQLYGLTEEKTTMGRLSKNFLIKQPSPPQKKKKKSEPGSFLIINPPETGETTLFIASCVCGGVNIPSGDWSPEGSGERNTRK